MIFKALSASVKDVPLIVEYDTIFVVDGFSNISCFRGDSGCSARMLC